MGTAEETHTGEEEKIRTASCGKADAVNAVTAGEQQQPPAKEGEAVNGEGGQKPWISVLQNMRTPTICGAHKRIMTLASSSR